jgi:hypothetical protein
MSEEINKEDVPETTPEEKQLSPIEQKALEMGWRPKEEFDGDEENFIDAKEFVQRQPLFDKISSQSKELKGLKRALEDFKTHYTTVQESAYKKALNELKSEQKKAFAEGDADTFYALEQQREEIENEKEKFVQQQQTFDEPETPREFQAWVNRNPWYNVPHMQVFADDVGSRFKGQVLSGAMTPADVLKEVEKAVRAEFPNKFRNANKDKAPSVEGGSQSGSGKNSGGSYELTEQERKIMSTLTSMKDKDGKPLITKEQYIADLKKAKGL